MDVVIVKGSREVARVDGLENICGKVEAIGSMSGSGWSWNIGDIVDGYDGGLVLLGCLRPLYDQLVSMGLSRGMKNRSHVRFQNRNYAK